MLRKIRFFLLKNFYKLLIVKIIILNKNSICNYNKLIEIGKLEVKTNIGNLFFVFKQDKNSISRNKLEELLMIKTFIIELVIDESIPLRKPFVRDKVGLVVKLCFSRKVDFDILSHAIADKFVKKLYFHILEEN